MCSLCQLPVAKKQFWANFDIFRGSCTDPLSPMRAKFGVLSQTYGIRLRTKFRVDRFILSPTSWLRKTPSFAIFSSSAFSGVASWQQSDKVEHGCTTTNLPLSNCIKIVSIVQRHHGEIGRTNSDFQKRDEQTTDRQTDRQTTFFGRPGGRLNPSSNKLGTVIEDIEHVLAPGKRFGVWRIVRRYRGRWKFGDNQTLST